MTMQLPHEWLPDPFRRLASLILLEDVKNADFYLATACVLLIITAMIQLHVLSKPRPVPRKKLPKRPALSILFKPDDIAASAKLKSGAKLATSTIDPAPSSSHYRFRKKTPGSIQVSTSFQEEEKTQNESSLYTRSLEGNGNDILGEPCTIDEDEGDLDWIETPSLHPSSLPDSFAPLLSSSHVELLHDQLTVDLVHAVHAKMEVRLREGSHEIPLDKDGSRPQLRFNVQEGGCRMSVSGSIGSDGFTVEQDLDISCPTLRRSKSMVKNASVAMDPPIPLSNVAPTLIHFPTLFEDKLLLTLRAYPLLSSILDSVQSISSLIERCLWIVESKCQVHIHKIRVAPVYKDSAGIDHSSPEWNLSLAFSGHVLVFGVLPIPFVNVQLPTFIIPQPHALLERLFTDQPLASAKLRRENIAEERIALATLTMIESWSVHSKLVATPPAVGVDLSLPGGVAVAMEMSLGRDPYAGRQRDLVDRTFAPRDQSRDDGASMSSWTTKIDAPSGTSGVRRSGTRLGSDPEQFDANTVLPWLVDVSAKGTLSDEKASLHLHKLEIKHELDGQINKLGARGSAAIWKQGTSGSKVADSPALRLRRLRSDPHPELQSESRSVLAIFLFANESALFRNNLPLLQYDYVFDVHEASKLDAVTLSVGATHPMLNGGTMMTAILESIFAYGSISARENAVLDPQEMFRKRNILRHLPATDFHFGIQNIFIPPESESYSDDGQTIVLPDLERGRMHVHILGGVEKEDISESGVRHDDTITEGIRLSTEFELPFVQIRSEGLVKEFPELDIFDGATLRAFLNGAVQGSVRAHLRPQSIAKNVSATGPNVLNPLEAYELDFSKSSLCAIMKECSLSLAHRRVVFPAETSFVVSILQSVLDMGFEGKTQCELGWDFQGLSPILQVTPVGQTPEDAAPEDKKQVSILINPLRQGRLSFHLSPVGGISITKAATSREDKEGLYDWKFFNALLSPDEESPGRILDVLHDKRSMNKCLQVVELVNQDIFKMLQFLLQQVWRGKEILDKEGIKEIHHAIPMEKLARILSLFLSGGTEKVVTVLPIVDRVIQGDGIDVVKLKELLRDTIEQYDDWATEIDRLVRWASVAFGPIAVPDSYVEELVPPLAELPHHASRFRHIPSAAQLYEGLNSRPQLPLDIEFSKLVGRMAPYLDFRQVEFILEARPATDWQPSDLRRIRYVYSIKRKVLDIAESYGGLSFLPQSFLVSVFLGEATRGSHRTSSQYKIRRNSPKESRSKAGTRGHERDFRRQGQWSTLSRLRRQRTRLAGCPLEQVPELREEHENPSPAEQVASTVNNGEIKGVVQSEMANVEPYELGDCLLGPKDVAILLQAGLASVMKSSSVVQLNQRMLLDLICSQPLSFAVAVLAEIGTPSGQGSPRALTSALMALLELDQTSFKESHKLDMRTLLESWLPGLRVPRREDYMAGGRWARQSYYDSLFNLSKSILEDAEPYMALRGHIQRVRHSKECDVPPHPRTDSDEFDTNAKIKLKKAVEKARRSIEDADQQGSRVVDSVILDSSAKLSVGCKTAIEMYERAFTDCQTVMSLDKYAFHADWFRDFYNRNYDALMIKSMLDNIVNDVDNTQKWYVF